MTKTATAPKQTAKLAQPSLGLMVRLNFNDSNRNSHKFHDSVLIGKTRVVRYGRNGTMGQQEDKACETVEKAAAEYWQLLRSKIGKGYHVEAARILLPSDIATLGARYDLPWERLLPTRSYGVSYPEKQGLSARTPKQGASVILTLMDPNADQDALLASAQAGPTERFLLPLVLSHPNCPEEAQVFDALVKGGALFSED